MSNTVKQTNNSAAVSQQKTLLRLLSYSRPYRKSLVLALLLLALASAAEVLGPIIISYFIDHVLSTGNLPLKIVSSLALAFILLHVVAAFLRYQQSIMFNRIAISIVQNLRNEVMQAALNQPLAKFDREPLGQLVSRVTNDTEVIKDLYVTVIATVLRCVSLIIAALIAMFSLQWQLALIAMTIFPIVALLMAIYQRMSTPIVRRVRTLLAEINNDFNEGVNGILLLQQFRQQQRYGERITQTNQQHYRNRMKVLQIEALLLRPLLSLVSAIILSAILLSYGLTSAQYAIGVGVLYAFINYLSRLNEPLVELTSQQAMLQQAIVAGERVFTLMDDKTQHYGTQIKPLTQGQIELRNLTFSYQSSLPILTEINFTIMPLSFVAIVGHTGSGKSTLASLLMGYYPVEDGMLWLDGHDINQLSHQVLRSAIAMVQQDTTILANSIYHNITLGRSIEPHEVWQVLGKVQLADWAKTLPKGLETELGEGGNVLSVGQKQLIALARVLLLKPKILILDEVTANIDSGTEQLIQQALTEIKRHTTIVMIAHRLSTIIEADAIMVLNQGVLVEHGDHQTLLAQKGRYYQMYQLQAAAIKLQTDNNR